MTGYLFFRNIWLQVRFLRIEARSDHDPGLDSGSGAARLLVYSLPGARNFSRGPSFPLLLGTDVAGVQ